jgi:hypothetical protein
VHRWPAFLCALGLCLLAELGVRPTGDSTEYLLAARALASHGTPSIRVTDVEWLAAREPALRKVALPLAEGMRRGELIPLPSVRRGVSGAYYSLHFWFYSLLCAPFLWLTELLALAPIRALALVNALAASVAALGLWAHFGRGRLGVLLGGIFVLSGTTFYLGWTGPEVLTGSALIVACLASRRGELGKGLVAGAVAAAQNPSAILIWLYVVWSWGTHEPREKRPLNRREAVLAALALALALLPYAFFYEAFRVPSIIATFATDFSLIGFERAWSLVFDLNEGMLFGLPGLLLGTLAATALGLLAAPRSERRRLATNALATALVIACMAVPTFAIHNWNSGASVLIRYGYWLAMPLLPLFGELAQHAGVRSRWILFGVAALLQIAVIAVHGVWGQHYSYVRHTWAAKRVLGHFPAAYNPVPEIFYERTLGSERPLAKTQLVVWPYRGRPRKLLVREGVKPRSKRICPDGSVVTSPSVRPATGDWLYLDAPFACGGREPGASSGPTAPPQGN